MRPSDITVKPSFSALSGSAGQAPRLRYVARHGLGEPGAPQLEAQRLFRTKEEDQTSIPRHIIDALGVTRGLGLENGDEQRIRKAVDEPVANVGPTGARQRFAHARSYMVGVLNDMRHLRYDVREEILKRSFAYWRWRFDVDAARPTQRFVVKKSFGKKDADKKNGPPSAGGKKSDVFSRDFKPTKEPHPAGDGQFVRFHENVVAHVPQQATVEHHAAENAKHVQAHQKFREVDPLRAEAHAHAANLHYKLGHAMARQQQGGPQAPGSGLPPQQLSSQMGPPSHQSPMGAPPMQGQPQFGGAAAQPNSNVTPSGTFAPPGAQQQPGMPGMGGPPQKLGQRPVVQSADAKQAANKFGQQQAAMMPPPKPGKGPPGMGAGGPPGMGKPPQQAGMGGPQPPGGGKPPMGAPAPQHGAPGQQPGMVPGAGGPPAEPQSDHEPGVHSERTRFSDAHPDVRGMHDVLNRATKIMADISAAHDHIEEMKERCSQVESSNMPPRQKRRALAQYKAEQAAAEHDLVHLEDEHDTTLKEMKSLVGGIKSERVKKNPFLTAFMDAMDKLGNFGSKVSKEARSGGASKPSGGADEKPGPRQPGEKPEGKKSAFAEARGKAKEKKKTAMVKSAEWSRAIRLGHRVQEEIRKSLGIALLAPIDRRRIRPTFTAYDPMQVW